MTSDSYHFLAVDRCDGAATAQLLELDREAGPDAWRQLRDELLRFLEENDSARMMIDFANLDSFGYGVQVASSAMNCAFAAAFVRARQTGVELHLCRVPASVLEVYRVSRLEELATIDETPPDVPM